jgi:hypothetical protein
MLNHANGSLNCTLKKNDSHYITSTFHKPNASLDGILYVQLPYTRTQHYYAGQTWLSICYSWTLQMCFAFLNKDYSSVNGRFRVETNEVRRVDVHSSFLVVTSNQNAANKIKYRLNIFIFQIQIPTVLNTCCVFYFHVFVFLDVLFRTFDVILQWRQNMRHVIFHVWGVSWRKTLYFQWNITEKSSNINRTLLSLFVGFTKVNSMWCIYVYVCERCVS